MPRLSRLHRVCFFFLSVFAILHLPFSVSGLNREGRYLQRLKLFLSDPNDAFSSWSERDPTPCSWAGVECDCSGAVVAVTLSGYSLAGPFPDFLCSLPSLAALNLSNNYINSTLPLSISRCRNLISLDLSQNLIGGPIPDTLSDLHFLRHLDISYCSFSGQIPATFGRFRSLETLVLSDNELNGIVPAILGNITSLKRIELAYNQFSPSQFPAELGNLTNLEYLWLGGCNLVGPIPESIGRLSRLTNFDVSNNRLTGLIPSTISQMKSIVQIELFNNSLTGELPARWSNLTQLRRIDASMNSLTGTIPRELCELPLESLSLFQNQLEGSVPESIANSSNLKELKLFHNRFIGPLPSQLGLNSALSLLDVSYNNFSRTVPEGLCDGGSLSVLILMNNSFSGNIPVNLRRCLTLKRIRFRFNQLSGEVPAEFFGLPLVYLLDLSDNDFSGNISTMISAAKSLESLQISRNRFSSFIPIEIGTLAKLGQISASQNELQGEIPSTLMNMKQLLSVDLSNNNLSGKIPNGIQSMVQLIELNLANNQLSGELPYGIGNLPVLNYLDLSGNQFSGIIPSSFENLKLNTFNLSNNRLSGEIPPLFDKSIYWDSFLGNPALCRGLCSSMTKQKHEGHTWLMRAIYAMIVVVFLLGIGLNECEILKCLEDSNVIGNGASGKVYKASLSNGEIVAVKKLRNKDEFDIEVETLGKIRHNNIVKLWCCCDAGDCNLLVYEYMPRGSLGDLLHCRKGVGMLNWPTRFKVVCDAANGLSYLHHDCLPPIVHRDIKSNNILLNDDFGAKISDFGVAKVVRCAESMSVIAGSYGYIAPEYAYTLHVNEKSDIYSFGVVMLELVTGRRAVEAAFGEKDLVSWVTSNVNNNGLDKVIDPNMDSCFKEHICKVLDIALLCVSTVPLNRPSMRNVVKLLRESHGNLYPMVRKN
ncbi:unnamed protein product [Cuscuta europaea]|uniref:non-specific serine/threonine protein kinase n=1 Tax=Cuscuta europaea TaxID=41803 RepID=A0A9P1A025_CUSEU|nr:unnamed protein product [Cuscuta europaea]CAH9116665.1 unnamed protein product [Cuscuta europaea]